MNKAYLENQIDNFSNGTYPISQELKDFLFQDYYCTDKENDNLVIYELNQEYYGLVVDDEIIVSDDYDGLYLMFKHKSEELCNYSEGMQHLLYYGLTVAEATKLYQRIKKEILDGQTIHLKTNS